jgi:hypothetical protein
MFQFIRQYELFFSEKLNCDTFFNLNVTEYGFPYRSFRLQSKRPLKNLMMTTAGCDQRSAGIGNIAYVKDLQTEKIVTTKLRCSKFGFAHHHLLKFGWVCTHKCTEETLGDLLGYIDCCYKLCIG